MVSVYQSKRSAHPLAFPKRGRCHAVQLQFWWDATRDGRDFDLAGFSSDLSISCLGRYYRCNDCRIDDSIEIGMLLGAQLKIGSRGCLSRMSLRPNCTPVFVGQSNGVPTVSKSTLASFIGHSAAIPAPTIKCRLVARSCIMLVEQAMRLSRHLRVAKVRL